MKKLKEEKSNRERLEELAEEMATLAESKLQLCKIRKRRAKRSMIKGMINNLVAREKKRPMDRFLAMWRNIWSDQIEDIDKKRSKPLQTGDEG